MVTQNRSNAMTALRSERLDALQIVSDLETKYQMTVAPNTGELRHSVFRVAHMGVQTIDDLSALLSALTECMSTSVKKMKNGAIV